MQKALLFGLAATLVFIVIARGGTTLADETFADGNRTGQTPPGSLAWFTSSAAESAVVADGKLTLLAPTGRGSHVAAHFAPLAQPFELRSGQSLVLTFDLKVVTAQYIGGPSVFLGLFNSENDSVNYFTEDEQNPRSATSAGYAAAVSLVSRIASNLAILKRAGAGSLLTSLNGYKTRTLSETPVTLAKEGAYAFELRIQHADPSTMVVKATISGGGLAAPVSVEYRDGSNLVTAFDTIGIAIGGAVPAAEISAIRLVIEP